MEKIEATAQDVVTVAQAVWERPDLVPGPPKIRVGFLAMLLLASIAGFRPKALQKIKYSQISFSLVKKSFMATINIRKVKQRGGAGEEWYVKSNT
jgi:hypothetical protein